MAFPHVTPHSGIHVVPFYPGSSMRISQLIPCNATAIRDVRSHASRHVAPGNGTSMTVCAIAAASTGLIITSLRVGLPRCAQDHWFHWFG